MLCILPCLSNPQRAVTRIAHMDRGTPSSSGLRLICQVCEVVANTRFTSHSDRSTPIIRGKNAMHYVGHDLLTIIGTRPLHQDARSRLHQQAFCFHILTVTT